jgi:hypothetical protein
LQLLYIAQLASEEVLFRLIEGDLGHDNLVLKQKLQLTVRESEVLMWTAREIEPRYCRNPAAEPADR